MYIGMHMSSRTVDRLAKYEIGDDGGLYRSVIATTEIARNSS